MFRHAPRELATTLLATLLICAGAAFGVGTDAQGQAGKTAPSQNAQKQKSKQIFLSGKNESTRGSSVTIRSDTPLNDYSAYRSGDRFYVVIPKANANSMPKGTSGRGFSDMQVQQRGNDVVLSYRLQPGAKPRVNQRFDRLDVVFDTAEAAGSSTASNPDQSNQTPATTSSASTAAQTNQSQRPTATPQPATSSAPANTNRPSADTGQTAAVAPGVNTAPAGAQPPLTAPQTTDETTSAQPSATPVTGEQPQLAQAQPPPTTAPVTATKPAAAPGASSSFATAILRNWPALIGALLLMGIVLFVMAQRSASKHSAPPAGEEAKALSPVAFKDATAPELKPKTSPAVAAKPVRTEPSIPAPPPVVVAAPLAGATIVEEQPAERETTQAEAFAENLSVEGPTAVAEESPTVETSVGPETFGELEELTLTRRSLLDEQVTDEVGWAVPADAEAVQDETRRLLAGDSYNKGVLSRADVMSRQMIAAELLAALAGRNAERRQRARTAFVEHGFFNETAHDLHFAEAPAERASAARSLALVSDRLATSHLIAALADPTMEVRRACVEALAELGDPKAVPPLQSLLEREKASRVKIPRKLIERAIKACERGGEEMPAPRAATETAALPTETPAALQIAKDVEPAAPAADDETPTLVAETPPPPVVTEQPSVVKPVAAETLAPWTTPAVGGAEDAEVSEASAPHAGRPAEILSSAWLGAPVEDVALKGGSDKERAPSPQAPQALEPPPPLFVGESLAVPTEEMTASTEELVAPTETLIPAEEELEELELGSKPAETTGIEAAVHHPAPSETAREKASAEQSEWIELDVSDFRSVQPAGQEQAPAAEVELSREDSMGVAEITPGPAEPPSIEPLPIQTAPGMLGVETVTGSIAEVATRTPAGAGDAALEEDASTVPQSIAQRLVSEHAAERATAIGELGRLGNDVAFHEISSAFDDPSVEVRSAAARSLYEMQDDRAEAFTRALREAAPDRRRNIGAAIATSGLAGEAISQLTGASRDKTYEAFSLLFLMAKAGEVQPLIRAIEGHPDNEVRLAVVKLLALSGQKEILPAFRRLAVRGSLPTDVRSAVMEAIYQISSSQTPQEANS